MRGWLRRQGQVGLDAAGSGGEVPAGKAQQQIHAAAAATSLLAAAALVAEPAARAVIAVPAVAVGAAAGGARLMAVLQLLRCQSGELDQQPRPLASSSCQHIGGHQRWGVWAPAGGAGC